MVGKEAEGQFPEILSKAVGECEHFRCVRVTPSSTSQCKQLEFEFLLLTHKEVEHGSGYVVMRTWIHLGPVLLAARNGVVLAS